MGRARDTTTRVFNRAWERTLSAEEPANSTLAARSALPIAFGVCAVATVALLLGARHLPMADAPQHAAQVALWGRMGDPEFAYADLYRFNWFTPYLPAYLVARACAVLGLGVHAGVRVVVLVSVLGLPGALWVLLRVTARDPWLSLIGFPLAFGIAFYWGFLNFLLALPLGVLVIAAAFRAVDRGGGRWGVGVALASVALFFAHPLVWGPCVLVVLCRAGLDARLEPRIRALRGAPILAAAPVALAWIVAQKLGQGASAAAPLPMILDLTPVRLAELPALLIGPDRAAVATLAALALGVGLTSAGIARERVRWAPAAVVLALYLLMPSRLMGTDFVYHRLAGLGALLALLALDPAPPTARRRLAGRALIVLAALVWLGVLGARFERFNEQAAGFDVVAREVPQGAEVFGVMLDADAEPLPGTPFLHFVALLQVERSLLVEPSFSRNFPQLVLYRPGGRTLTPEYQSDYPEPELLARELAAHRYTHVLVRSRGDPLGRLPVLGTPPWALAAEHGDWRLFRAE